MSELTAIALATKGGPIPSGKGCPPCQGTTPRISYGPRGMIEFGKGCSDDMPLGWASAPLQDTNLAKGAPKRAYQDDLDVLRRLGTESMEVSGAWSTDRWISDLVPASASVSQHGRSYSMVGLRIGTNRDATLNGLLTVDIFGGRLAGASPAPVLIHTHVFDCKDLKTFECYSNLARVTATQSRVVMVSTNQLFFTAGSPNEVDGIRVTVRGANLVNSADYTVSAHLPSTLDNRWNSAFQLGA